MGRISSIHPGRWTWTIIMEVWKIIFLSKWVICRFHVNLPGCKCVCVCVVSFPCYTLHFYLRFCRTSDVEDFEALQIQAKYASSANAHLAISCSGWDPYNLTSTHVVIFQNHTSRPTDLLHIPVELIHLDNGKTVFHTQFLYCIARWPSIAPLQIHWKKVVVNQFCKKDMPSQFMSI